MNYLNTTNSSKVRKTILLTVFSLLLINIAFAKKIEHKHSITKLHNLENKANDLSGTPIVHIISEKNNALFGPINGVINAYAAVTSIAGTNFDVDDASSFGNGDLVMIIQMQGATINTTNTSAYGDIISYNDVGNFELVTIASVAGNTISFGAITKTYDANGTVQIIKVPDYSSTANTTVNATVTGQPFDGTKGGVIVLHADELTLNADINATGLGFRGGSINTTDYRTGGFVGLTGAQKGEGIAKFSALGDRKKGKQANGGGAGNYHNTAGAGGGNLGLGGRGGEYRSNTQDRSGSGGYGPQICSNLYGLPATAANTLYMGGGGGAGDSNNSGISIGGSGGGIIFIFANTITGGTGKIIANGTAGTQSNVNDGSSGGGAGGTLFLDIATSVSGTINIDLNGGNGGNASQNHSAGGGGGGGALFYSNGNLPANYNLTANGGAAGTGSSSNTPEDGFSGGIATFTNPPIIADAQSFAINIGSTAIGDGLIGVSDPGNSIIDATTNVTSTLANWKIVGPAHLLTAFAIDSNSGKITLNDLSLVSSLGVFEIYVQVENATGEISCENTITIDVQCDYGSIDRPQYATTNTNGYRNNATNNAIGVPNGNGVSIYNTNTNYQAVFGYTDAFSGGQNITITAKNNDNRSGGLYLQFSDDGTNWTSYTTLINGFIRAKYTDVNFTIPSSFSGSYKYIRTLGEGSNTYLNIDAFQVHDLQCNNCPAGSTAPILSAVTVSNSCPSPAINLTTLTASNTPANTVLTWHTNTPATTANLVADATTVTAGVYYAAFYNGAQDCYSGDSGTATTIVLADGDNDCDGIINSVDIDDDNDGILDTTELKSCASKNYNNAANKSSVGITTDAITVLGGIQRLTDNLQTPDFYFANQPIAGLTLIEFEFPKLEKIEGFEIATNGYSFLSNGATVKVQGSLDGTTWNDLTPTLNITPAILNNGIYSSQTYTEKYALTQNTGNYYTKYRILGISGTASSSTRVREIYFSKAYDPFCDTDGDGVSNQLDLDSDGDSCSDSVEAGNTLVSNNNTSTFNTGADVNANGLLDVFENGTTGTTNYTPANYLVISNLLNACADTDGDGVGDLLDLDSDNDGVLDSDEQNCDATKTIQSSELDWHGRAAENITYPTATSLDISGTHWATAYSDQVFSLPLKIEGTITAAVHGMIGFLPESKTELTGNGWNDSAYKFQLHSTRGMYIRHEYSRSGWHGPSIIGKKFVLSIDKDGQMTYSHDGTVVYIGAVSLEKYKIVLTRGPFAITDFTVTTIDDTCGYIDTDGDTVFDHLDLDSDNDGCSDSVEASNTPRTNNNTTVYNTGADVNNNGLLDVFENGTTGTINYTSTYQNYATVNALNFCTDTDGDGIGDITDIDDDNDGVLDVMECESTPISLTTGSSPFDGFTVSLFQPNRLTPTASDSRTTPGSLSAGTATAVYNTNAISSISNSEYEIVLEKEFTGANEQQLLDFSLDIGSTTSGQISDAVTVYLDNTIIYEDRYPSRTGEIINITAKSPSDNPTLKIVIYHTQAGGNNDPIIKNVIGSTLFDSDSCFTDTDGDTIPNNLDLDSDGDGCSDSVEAGNTLTTNNNITNYKTGADTNNNGLLDIFENGTTGDINYTPTYVYAKSNAENACIDTDGDGISDVSDIDSDNDGILDRDERNCTASKTVGPTDLSWHGTAAANITAPTATTLAVSGRRWQTAYSDQTFSLPIKIEGTLSAIEHGMIGLLPVSTPELTTGTWNDFGYKFQFNSTHGMYVRHGDRRSGWHGPTILGRKFILEIDVNGNMTYSNNGVIVYNGSAPVEDYKITISRGAFTINNFLISSLGDTCANINSDTDGIPDHLDLDSDNDGCSDSVEAGSTNAANNDIVNYNTGADVNRNGLLDIFENGTTGTINYVSTNHVAISSDLNACADTDGDGLGDLVDLDDDNDGILDSVEMLSCENDNLIAPTAVDSYSSTWNTSVLLNSHNGLGLTGEGTEAIHATRYSHHFLFANGRTTGSIKYDMPSNSDINGIGIWVSEISSHPYGLDGPLKDFTVEIIYDNGANVYNSQKYTTSISDLGKLQNFNFGLILKDVISIKINVANGWVKSSASYISSDDTTVPSNYNIGIAEFRALCAAKFVDTDGDNIYNHLDLDSDGDGVPDNIEAQSTLTFLAPSGTINANGVYTNYAGGLLPIDTDGDDIPDYIDTDSDSGQGTDTVEGALTLSNTDSDTDGLDDAIDTDDANFAPVNAGITDVLAAYPDNGVDVDWRTQCPNGVIVLDPSYATSATGASNWGTPSNITGGPNGSRVGIYRNNNVYIQTVDFGKIFPAHSEISIYAQKIGSYDNNYIIEYSTDNITYEKDPDIAIATTTNFTEAVYIAKKQFRYLRLKGHKNNSHIKFDALSINSNICVMYTGEIFHDSGLGGGTHNDNIKNGTEGAFGLPTDMFVNVVDASNTIVFSTAVETDGTYKVPELADGNYTLVLTDDKNSITSTLPNFWLHSLGGSGTYTITVAANMVTTPSNIPLLGIYLCGEDIIASYEYAIASIGSVNWGGEAQGAANSPDGKFQNVYSTSATHQTVVEFANTFSGGQSIELWAKQHSATYNRGIRLSFSEDGTTYTSNSLELNGFNPTSFTKIKYEIPASLTGNYKYVRVRGVNGRSLLYLDAVKVNLPLGFSTPKVRTILTVKDGLGVNLENTNIALATDFFYHIDFQNVGYDKIQDLVIVFKLPENVEVDLSDITAPTEVTPSYDAANHQLLFTVGNSIVELGDPSYNIKIKANLIPGCENYRAACANEIKAQTLSSYKGTKNTAQINDIPSITGLDTCDIPLVGTTDFNIDLLNICDFKREEVLCGGDLLLEAAAGFDTYEWKNSTGNVVGNTSSYSATSPGVYTVSVTSSCLNYTEEITVINFGGNITNPVLAYADDTAICPNDGSELPKLLLCGANDTRLIETSLLSVTSIEWQKLDETTCSNPLEDRCANRDNSCWTTFFTGANYTIEDEGKYRLKINYPRGCFNFHYFNVYKNDLDPSVTVKNLICGNSGSLTVGNIPTGAPGYEFSLDGIAYTTANPIDITTEGNYKVYIRRVGHTPGECIFTEDVLVEKTDLDVDVFPTHIDCEGEKGSIRIHANDVDPQYYFKLTQGANVIGDSGPKPDKDFTFEDLNGGLYTIEITTDDGCIKTIVDYEIEDHGDLTAGIDTAPISCNDGRVIASATGGTEPYQYAIYSYNTTIRFDVNNPDPAKLQASSDFDVTNAGTYQIVVMDANGCFKISAEKDVLQDTPPVFTVTPTNITCFVANVHTGAITVDVTNTPGGLISYSIDGITFQSTNIFTGLAAGSYTVIVRKELGGSVCYYPDPDPNNVPITTITSPDTALSAYAGIQENVICSGVAQTAKVAITNARGGTGSYIYSFDGGVNYSTTSVADLAVGTHNLFIKDDANCTFPMTVTVAAPPVAPDLNIATTYNCDGTGEATLSISDPSLNYFYELDGNPNTPADSNVFKNIPAGNHTITINYLSSDIITTNVLFVEDFGVNQDVENLSTAFCFEPQDSSNTCGTNDEIINSGEYSVTNTIINPNADWVNAVDYGNQLSWGRFLAVNIGNTPTGTILYRNTITNIIPNRDISVAINALNLLKSTATGMDPDITIQLVNGANVVVAQTTSGAIAKNEAWNKITLDADPGANTSLDLVIRTNSSGATGNAIALDSFEVFQAPKECFATKDINFSIDAGRSFSATTTALSDISCNGAADGTLTFNVENFDSVGGFEYSVNGDPFITSTTSPVLVSGIGTTAIAIIVRDKTTTSCAVTINETIAEPNTLTSTLAITTALSCNNGATITVTTTEGVPTYTYQLEDTSGGIINSYQADNYFTDIINGDYIVRVKDANECETTTAITINPIDAISFTTTVTPCYSGASDGSITVDVTAGNGDYTFSINGPTGPWVVPTPSTAVTHTFNSLTAGTYDIYVRDALGCQEKKETIVISSLLTATILVTDISCNDGEIAITAAGGDTNYVYAYKKRAVPTTPETVTLGDFSTSATRSIATIDAGTYDVFVRDHSGGTDFCEFTTTVTINAAPALTINPVANAPRCNGENGDIQLSITAGDGPFDIALTDLDHAGANNVTITASPDITHAFYNLPAGDYTVAVTDVYGCVSTSSTITVSNPELLDATIEPIHPPTCGDLTPANNGFEFTAYPDYTAAGLTIEFSHDGGTTWVPTSTFTGFLPGVTVTPAMRTIDGSSVQQCIKIFDPYLIPYPLRNLFPIPNIEDAGCQDGMKVRVDQYGGVTDIYTNFQFSVNQGPWLDAENTTPPSRTFNNLIPGREYTFYLKDEIDGCIVQNDVDVYRSFALDMDIAFLPPTPTCDGSNTGEITFLVSDVNGVHKNEIRWELYDQTTDLIVQSSATNVNYSSGNAMIPVSGLAAGKYYLVATQVDAMGTDSCIGGSKDVVISQGAPITGTPALVSGITCDTPGFISVPDITGGWGPYTYTISSTNFTADIVSTDSAVEIPYANLINTALATFTASVTVVDQYGCTPLPINLGDVNVTIAQPGTITDVITNNCTAPYSIIVTPAPGPDYVYSIDNGVTFVDNSGIFNDVATGTHNVVIKDKATGCTVSHSTSTIIYPAFEATAIPTTLLGCASDAQVTITVSNGAGDYDYEVSGDATVTRTNFAGDDTIINITAAGSYTITVYDNNRATCPALTIPVKIEAAIMPSIAIDSFEDIKCNGNNNGTISVSTTDAGYGPYLFSITANNGAPLGVAILPTSTTNNTAVFTGLAPATGSGYTIQVSATNSCTATIDQVINEPDAIVLPTLTATSYSCAAGNTANQITVSIDKASIIGGTSPFVSFEFIYDNGTLPNTVQSGANTSFIIPDLIGGSVTLNVYDAKGCMATSPALLIPNYDELISATINKTEDISCTNAGEDISIAVVSTNNDTAKFEYSDNNGASWTASNTFNDLAIGAHAFLVRHTDTGCTLTVNHNVNDPNTTTVVVNKTSDAVCVGSPGTITIDVKDLNYNAAYSYEIVNTVSGLTIATGTGTTNVISTAINVPAGSYSLSVVQSALPECTNTHNFQILDPPNGALTIDSLTEIHAVTCTDDKGAILAEASGGWGVIQYQFIDKDTGGMLQDYSTINTLGNLAAGNYTVNIKDEKGCPVTQDITLNATIPISATAILDTALLCNGGTDAIIEVNASFGEGNFVYTLIRNGVVSSTQQVSSTFTNLNAATYAVIVTDGWDCNTTTTPDIVIVNPDPIITTPSITRVLGCTTDAEITISASGGAGTYSYSDDGTNFQPSPIFNKGIGSYYFYTKDGNDCISASSSKIEINAVAPLIITLNDDLAKVNCADQNTAILSADVTGGLGDYEYELLDASNPSNPNPVIGARQANKTFSDLAAGTYQIKVYSKDCEDASIAITIDNPPAMIYNDPIVTDVTCAGANDGKIDFNNVTGGTGIIKYAISPNLSQFDDKSVFTDLAPGIYKIIIVDENGCLPIYREFEIKEPSLLESTIINVQQEFCVGDADASFEVDIKGGTGPFSTSLNSSDPADFVLNRTVFTGLEGGQSYNVFVKDAEGCTTSTSITLDAPVDLSAEVNIAYECQEDNIGLANTVTITIAAEYANDVTYTLDGDSATDQLENVFHNISPGAHTISIAHANGCVNDQAFVIQDNPEPLTLVLDNSEINTIIAKASDGGGDYQYSFNGESFSSENTYYIKVTDTYTVTVKDSYGCTTTEEIEVEFIDVKFPMYFSPNGDNRYDTWKPKNLESYPNAIVKIFDRYGRNIKTFGKDGEWDGTFKNANLPSGDYWYILLLNREDDTREFMGHFSLVR